MVESHIAENLATALPAVYLRLTVWSRQVAKLVLHLAMPAIAHVDVVLVAYLVGRIVVRLVHRHLHLALRLHHHHLLRMRLHLFHWVVNYLGFRVYHRMLMLNAHGRYIIDLTRAVLHVPVVVHIHVSHFVKKLFNVYALV